MRRAVFCLTECAASVTLGDEREANLTFVAVTGRYFTVGRSGLETS
jgi:hypothetical protein